MEKTELIHKLTALMQETGKAHHQAFIESDGADPEWALWYAEHLQKKLGAILGIEFTKSDLVYLLISAQREQETRAP
ncbi:MAG TPA: hypothetical protein VJZ27_11790, partial [Aggregatilineales bacterium]|nr:hypothetical protein [Aggregatilineales bacterium]